jgi:hypothetical protein
VYRCVPIGAFVRLQRRVNAGLRDLLFGSTSTAGTNLPHIIQLRLFSLYQLAHCTDCRSFHRVTLGLRYQMRVDSQRCFHVRVSELRLEYGEWDRGFCKFCRKPVPERVKPSAVFRNAEFSQKRFQHLLHDRLPLTPTCSSPVGKKQACRVGLPMVVQIVPQHCFQSGQRQKFTGSQARSALGVETVD